MERIQAQLSSVLTATDERLQRRLPAEESAALGILLEQMTRRWPAQDLQDSMDVFLEDLEHLALKFSLQRVQAALGVLRVDRLQKFFPRPDEVADEIENAMKSERAAASISSTTKLIDEMERDFWEWVDCRLSDADTAGMTEQELLDTVKRPGYTGRKARASLPSGSNVVSMPPRDQKAPAAGSQQSTRTGTEPWYLRD